MIESAPWEQLPDEIVVRILAEMEIEDLLIMKGVSKQVRIGDLELCLGLADEIKSYVWDSSTHYSGSLPSTIT